MGKTQEEALAGRTRVDPGTEAEIFRLAVHHAPSPILIADRDGTILVVNKAAEHLFEYDESELLGEPVEILMPGGMRDAHQAQRTGFMEKPEHRSMGERRNLVARTKDGGVIPVEVGLSPVETPSGLVVICGITDLASREREERHMAEVVELLDRKNQELLLLLATDGLTSLKSRQAFMDHLEVQIEVSVRNARPLSVLMLDIDHFKSYNDRFGHLAGDEVLKLMGSTLQQVARRSDFIGRLGGEEFGIILPETGREGSRILSERFRIAVEAREWPRRPIYVSVGATTVGFDETVPRPERPKVLDLLSQADRALYSSKEGGRNRVTHAHDLTPGS